MPARVTLGASDVLLAVDVQNDFCPGGKLPVPSGHEVVPVINRIAKRFAHVILTQDWHPAGHHSFASSHSGRQPFDTIEVAYGSQILWPDHCVQATRGAQFRDDLHIPHAELVLRKGFRPTIDSYSAFYENDRATATGLAFDFCVRYSAEDARKGGFDVLVIEDACRGIDVAGSIAATRESLAAVGVACVGQDAIG